MKKIFALGLLLWISPLMQAQDVTEFNQTIPKGKANNIKALIHVSGGQLWLNGGDVDLANVTCTYDKYEWNPTVAYAEQDKTGKLTVNAKIDGDEKRVDEDNTCTVILNNALNYSLGLVIGAGQANINLENMRIKKALFRLGVGSFNVNLTNTSIPLFKVEAGIGEATFDLSGHYKNDLSGMINAGIGEITLIVPKDMGVKVAVSGFLGSVDTPGYQKNGREHTNNLYGKTKYHIDLKIKGAIGTINIVEK